MFSDFEDYREFRRLWSAVRIERDVSYGLFTFGDSDLPYFLVTTADDDSGLVRIRRGEVSVSRARIITPQSMNPEFRDFFEDNEDFGMLEFLMARTAAFSNLKVVNKSGPDRIVTDTVAEAVDRLNHQLDDEEEDRVAILSAPAQLGGVALLRYTTERIMQSAPDNLQDLRERGLLP